MGEARGFMRILIVTLTALAHSLPSLDICEHSHDRTVCASRACRLRYAWCEMCDACVLREHAVLPKDEL